MDLYVFTWSNGLFNFFSRFSKYNPLVELINSISSIILSYFKLFQVKLQSTDVRYISKEPLKHIWCFTWIWYHLCNSKNVKSTHGGVILSGWSLQLTKNNTPPWVFSRFWNCTNGIKLRKTWRWIKAILIFCNRLT